MKKGLLFTVILCLSFSFMNGQPLNRKAGFSIPEISADKVMISDHAALEYVLEKRPEQEMIPNDIGISKAPAAAPIVHYWRPKGYFKTGLSLTGGAFTNNFLYGPAYYRGAAWRNLSIGATRYSWDIEDPENIGNKITSTKAEPELNYPFGTFDMPELTATNGGESSSYKWGKEGVESFLWNGGTLAAADGTFVGVGNYDLTLGLVNYSGQDGYLFGSGDTEGVANYYEKPAYKYVLDEVWVPLALTEGITSSTDFEIVIHRATVSGSRLQLIDTIAIARAKGYDLVEDLMLPFTEFKKKDPVLGLTLTYDYLEIEDGILVEFSWLNNPDVTLSVPCVWLAGTGSSSGAGRPNDTSIFDERNAYIFYTSGGNRVVGGWSDNNGNPIKTSLGITLFAYYTWLFTGQEALSFPKEGGQSTLNYSSYYTSDFENFTYTYLPDWLSVSTEDITESGEFSGEIAVVFIAEALPAGLEGRYANVTFSIPGASHTITITQGNTTGTNDVSTQSIKVISTASEFMLTYPSGFTSAGLYNVAGQSISRHNLPSNGTYSIPANNLPTGVYIIKLNGTKTETVKVIR